MALTEQQMADCRRWCGYPLLGDFQADDTRDYAYNWVLPGVWTTLYHRLTHLTVAEEAILVTTYLTTLASLETAITGAGDNLDTNVAAVWTRNPNEVSDRKSLFNLWRREMCAFIGIYPGPGLKAGGTISRA